MSKQSKVVELDIRNLHYNAVVVPMVDGTESVDDDDFPQGAIQVTRQKVKVGVRLVVSGGQPRVSHTGDAVADGGFANTGVVGSGHGVSVSHTGDAVATGGGFANSGVVRGSVSGNMPQRSGYVREPDQPSPFQLGELPFIRRCGGTGSVIIRVPMGTQVYH